MPVSRIACLIPRLSALAAGAAADEALALDALADAATAFSPAVERAEDAVYLEVGDLGRLYPTEGQLCEALAVATGEVGVECCIAIACDKGVARVRARGLAVAPSPHPGRAATAVVPGRSERLALGPLPLLCLGPSAELLAKLESWGLGTIGELAALPRPAVVTRLGAAGGALHRLACGESSEVLRPTPPSPELREEQELLDPLDNLEPLLFVLRGLLDRLVARLRARSQACGNLVLRLCLTPRGEETRQVAVAAPTQRVASLLDLVRVALESRPPPGTVERIIISTMPARPRLVQLDLFAPAGPAPERLATTLARLEALCGSGRVGRPVVPDTHLPGASDLATFAPPPSRSDGRPPAAAAPPPLVLAARQVRPPRPVTVARAGDALAQVSGAAGERSLSRQAVRRAGGPYRLRDVRGARDYYDVELVDGGLLRLFHDLLADRWFLDAVYD